MRQLDTQFLRGLHSRMNKLSPEGWTTWNTVDKRIKSEQVVVGKPLSANGSDPAHVHLRNVTKDSFDYKIEEWAYDDNWHTKDTFSSLAVKPDEHELLLADGSLYRVKAGTVSTDEKFVTHHFNSSFGPDKPVVLTQSQTTNGPTPIITRVKNVTSDSFSVRVQEEEQIWPSCLRNNRLYRASTRDRTT